MNRLQDCVNAHKSKGKGKGKLSAAAFERLALYTALVVQGLRAAYLVDGMALDSRAAEENVKEICQALGVPGDVAVLSLGEDNLLLIKSSGLRDKIAGIKTRRTGVDFPLFVSVDVAPTRAAPCIMSDEEMQPIWDCLERALHHTLPDHDLLQRAERADDSVVNQCLALRDFESVSRIVGLPFIAGWLLDYPCVYHSLVSDAVGGTLLSMQRLRKVSFSATTRGGGKSKASIDIMEFTVPICVLESSCDGSLAAAFTVHLDERKRGLDLLIAEHGDESVIDVISVEIEEFMLPHVMI